MIDYTDAGPTEDQIINWAEADDYRDDDDGDDRYDEYKDDLAMGYINPDGSQREPDMEPPEYPEPAAHGEVRGPVDPWKTHDGPWDDPPF